MMMVHMQQIKTLLQCHLAVGCVSLPCVFFPAQLHVRWLLALRNVAFAARMMIVHVQEITTQNAKVTKNSRRKMGSQAFEPHQQDKW